MNPFIRRTVGIVDVKFGANVIVIEPANLYGVTSAMRRSSGLSLKSKKEQRLESVAGSSPTRSFANWSRSGTTASFHMALCSLTISSATVRRPEAQSFGGRLNSAIM
jgi:hypothetical protein